MPHGKSSTTTVVSIRLPNEIYAIIKERAKRHGSIAEYATVSDYLRDRIIYDTTRKHGRAKAAN